MQRAVFAILLASVVFSTTGCGARLGLRASDESVRFAEPTEPRRINARSPWYPVHDDDLRFVVDYRRWSPAEQRLVHTMAIHERAKQMISEADDLIVMSFFLFDNLYAEAPPQHDLVGEITELLIAKRAANPDLVVVLQLDLFHKAWSDRRSLAVQQLREAGVNVFYSDRLQTRAASRLRIWEGINQIGRGVDLATMGVGGRAADLVGRTPFPSPGISFDNHPITFGFVSNASLLKANHRKVLLTRSDGRLHAMVTSWNPHNASALHENHALVASGPVAAYIYNVLREDVRLSARLGHRYVDYAPGEPHRGRAFCKRVLPELPEHAWAPPAPACADARRTEVAFATEQAIETMILEALEDVEAGDRIRVQMFFLSHVPVVNALIDAAARSGQPVDLLLDANREGINYSRDGTPNTQVADYLMHRAEVEGVRIRVRWYNTRGEQNHAKTMTITNAQTGKYWMTVGSANWTRKNLAGINLEANLFVRGSSRLNVEFNEHFTSLWSSPDPAFAYSIDWDDPRYEYHKHSGLEKWAVPLRHLAVFPEADEKGRPEVLEEELVHW